VTERLAGLDELVDSWLTLPEVGERLGLDVSKVRRLLQDRVLVAARVGERQLLCVPEALLADGEPLPDLRGTLSVLADSGYDDEASLRWLFTPDDTLPGSPVDNLRRGRKTEVRRRAQALAF
jgi:excisionase family DNA binding protein